MFHPREELSLSGSITLQLVSDDHSRYVRQALEQIAKERLRGPLIPAALDQNIQHVPLLTHRPPEIPVLAPDGEKHFIPIPFVARSRTSSTELTGIVLAEFTAPFTDDLIGHDYTAFKQSLLDIAEAQAERKV
jgi:hypothetical protein